MEKYSPSTALEDIRMYEAPTSMKYNLWNYVCLGTGIGTLIVSLYLMKNPEFLESFLFRKNEVAPIPLETEPLSEKGTNNVVGSLESKVSQNNVKSED